MQKSILILVCFSALLFGCSKLFVANDYRYSSNFKNYITYSFVDCDRDTSFMCEDIQQAILRQMRARGYEFNAQKPNVLVNYQVYYDRLKYKGYDQPMLQTWVSTEDDNFKYKPIKYDLERGTLMISIIENETSEVVWRGYATGIFNKNSSKKNYFKNIVSTIFDQYPLLVGDRKKKKFES
jgi:hypothetical protein